MERGIRDPVILRKMIENIEKADHDGSAEFLRQYLIKKVEKIESDTQKNNL